MQMHASKWKWLTALCPLALVFGVTTPAHAQYEDDYGYDDDREEELADDIVGNALLLGGGVTGFVESEATDFTDPQGSWGARFVLGTNMPIAFELAYEGTAGNIEAIGLDSDAYLMSNGGDALVRWNIVSSFMQPWQMADVRIEPFVFGGVGYRHYSLINDDFNTSSVQNSDNMGEVPLGGGIALTAGQFMLDARGTYRIAFEDDMFAAGDGLDRWGATANAGFVF